MRKTGESKPPGTVAAAPGRSLRASRARAHRSGAIRRHRESLPPPPPPHPDSFVLGRHGALALGPRGRGLEARMRAEPGGREGGQRRLRRLPNRGHSLQQ